MKHLKVTSAASLQGNLHFVIAMDVNLRLLLKKFKMQTSHSLLRKSLKTLRCLPWLRILQLLGSRVGPVTGTKAQVWKETIPFVLLLSCRFFQWDARDDPENPLLDFSCWTENCQQLNTAHCQSAGWRKATRPFISLYKKLDIYCLLPRRQSKKGKYTHTHTHTKCYS